MTAYTGKVEAVSRFYRTPCFPVGAGPDYVNAAALVTAPGDAASLLARLHEIEADFGRERVERWGMRTLDLDLLAFGNQVLPSDRSFSDWATLTPEKQRIRAPDELVLPHPRLHERAFVLIPLMDIAPDWVHPVFGLTVRQMVDGLSEEAKSEIFALKTQENNDPNGLANGG